MITVRAPAQVTKKCIHFTVKESLKRRNVDKHIVRVTTLNHSKLKTEILAEYKRHGVTADRYAFACELLKGIRSFKKKESNDKKVRDCCDYAETVSVILRSIELRLIMKCCLEKSLRDIVSGTSKRVKQHNREYYTQTLHDYLEYIDSLLAPSAVPRPS